MCKSQAQGGQRCSAHTRPVFEAARNGVHDAIRSGDTELAATMWDKYDKAAAEHASTIAGGKEIRSAAYKATNRDDHTEAAFMYNAARRGDALREQNAEAADLIADMAAFRSDNAYTFTSRSQLARALNPWSNLRLDEKPVEFTLNDGTTVYGRLSTIDSLDLVGRDGNIILRNIYDTHSEDVADQRITGMTLNPVRSDMNYDAMLDEANEYAAFPDLDEHQVKAAMSSSGFDPAANATVLASPRASVAQKRRAMEFTNTFDHSNSDQLTRWNAVAGLARIVENKDGTYSKDDQTNAYLNASDILTSSKRYHPQGFGHFQNVFNGEYLNPRDEGIDTANPANPMVKKMHDQIFNDGTGY